MTKQNCWEFKKCGRHQGGAKAAELGACVAATDKVHDTIHGGTNGGRACWVLAGTLCGGKVQGTFAAKVGNCMACEFYKSVKNDEGKDFILSKDLLNM